MAITAIAIVIASVIVGYFVNRQMKGSAINGKLEEALGKDAGYTETIIKAGVEPTGLSYDQLFELCDRSIEERTNLIVELRGNYPEIRQDLKSTLISFLNSENDLIRQKSRLYHTELAFSLALDSFKDAKKEYDSASTFSSLRDYYSERLRTKITELEDAVYTMSGNSILFVSAYESSVKEELLLKRAMGEEGLHFVELLQKNKRSNLEQSRNRVQALVNASATQISEMK